MVDPEEPIPENRSFKKKKREKSKFGKTMKKRLKIFPTQQFTEESKEKLKTPELVRSGSVEQLDISDLFNNNVISERVRVDPREFEQKEFELKESEWSEENKGFDTIKKVPELESEEDSQIIDENISIFKPIMSYIKPKQILSSDNLSNFKKLNFGKKSKTERKVFPQPLSNRKEMITEFQYSQINDEDFLNLFEETTKVIIIQWHHRKSMKLTIMSVLQIRSDIPLLKCEVQEWG